MIFNAKKFKELIKKRGTTARMLEMGTDIPANTIYGYTSGRSQPSAENLKALADVFDLNPEDLLIDEAEIQSEKINVADLYNVWKDETVQHLKAENQRLWLLVQKLTGAPVADLGKLTANIFATGQTPLNVSVIKPIAA